MDLIIMFTIQFPQFVKQELRIRLIVFLCLNLISIFASVALFHVVIVFVAVKLFDTFQTKIEWVWRTGYCSIL